ncbi:MAG: TlpA family protein disulfide reductase [Chloroflexota bacterium]
MSKNPKLRALLLLRAGLFAGLVCGLACTLGSMLLPWSQLSESLHTNAPGIGEPAPDFELADLSGERRRLSELRGKPVLLNFWATWCGPCTLEMPVFQHYSERYPDLQVVAVNANEPAETVEAFAEKWGLTFHILLDTTDSVNQRYQVFALPTTYFLDAEGQVRAVHSGSLNDRQLEKYLKLIGITE